MAAILPVSCGNCKFWSRNWYDLEDVPQDSGVRKDPDWGWCLCKNKGQWIGFYQHKQDVPGVGVETHVQGGCTAHTHEDGKQSAD